MTESLHQFEGSRAEFLKMLGEQDSPPAYIVRAMRVANAWQMLINSCKATYAEYQEMPRLKLGQAEAVVGSDWSRLGGIVSSPDCEYLQSLFANWKPTLRVPVASSSSDRILRRSARELSESFARFNRRWLKYVEKLDFETVNYERDQYNDYYLVEKSAALGSDKVAAHGFERMQPATTDEVLKTFPLLREV